MSKFKNIDEFLSLLGGVALTGKNQWQAKCPAHKDDNPSLSISQEDGKILLHCHASCSIKEVVSALGLRIRDLFLDATLGVRPLQPGSKGDPQRSSRSADHYQKAPHQARASLLQEAGDQTRVICSLDGRGSE
jgi:hypothetical protein